MLTAVGLGTSASFFLDDHWGGSHGSDGPTSRRPERVPRACVCVPQPVLDDVKLKLHDVDIVFEYVWCPNDTVFESRGKGEECHVLLVGFDQAEPSFHTEYDRGD